MVGENGQRTASVLGGFGGAIAPPKKFLSVDFSILAGVAQLDFDKVANFHENRRG
jgi:hypothetical protein